jgi:hypothetical protein
MAYSISPRDPHAVQRAKEAARAEFLGAAQTERLKDQASRYNPGYGIQAPQNSLAWNPASHMSLEPLRPTHNPLAIAAWNTAHPGYLRPGESGPAIDPRSSPVSRIASVSPQSVVPPNPAVPAASPAMTPSSTVLQPGDPNHLKPGEFWQRPGVDPRGGSPLVAPDGVRERVGSPPGRGGGNIISMWKPNVYNGPGESPTGVVYPTPAAPLRWDQQLVQKYPALGVKGTPEHSAFISEYTQNPDPAKAEDIARRVHENQRTIQGTLTGGTMAAPPVQQI